MRLIRLGEILVFCVSLLVAQAAAAAVYKWTDAQGRVHYSSQPPPGQSAEAVKIRQGSPAAAEQPPQANRAATADAPAQSAADEDAARQARREALRKNCEIARKNLAALEDPTYRRFRLEEGKEPEFLTDEQRQAQIVKARSQVQEFCIEEQPQDQRDS